MATHRHVRRIPLRHARGVFIGCRRLASSPPARSAAAPHPRGPPSRQHRLDDLLLGDRRDRTGVRWSGVASGKLERVRARPTQAAADPDPPGAQRPEHHLQALALVPRRFSAGTRRVLEDQLVPVVPRMPILRSLEPSRNPEIGLDNERGDAVLARELVDGGEDDVASGVAGVVIQILVPVEQIRVAVRGQPKATARQRRSRRPARSARTLRAAGPRSSVGESASARRSRREDAQLGEDVDREGHAKPMSAAAIPRRPGPRRRCPRAVPRASGYGRPVSP